MVKIRYACFLLLLFLFCCRKPYDPPVISTQKSHLVVEGVINTGDDSTIIRLTRTIRLDSTSTTDPVLNAVVILESDHNTVWLLNSLNGDGYYGIPSFNLPVSQQYRLRIVMGDGKQYLSDFMPVKPTPPIDSIGYYFKNNMVNIYVNTHDPSNNTRYYRWNYEETWHFHSDYESRWVLDIQSRTIVPRPAYNLVHYCWAGYQSSNIIINSSAKLSSDVIYQQPITQVPITSEKIEDRYSILIKQYAMTAEAYAFYQNLKKNTEDLGGIFDAQPTELANSSNIHSVDNPAELVIGYVQVTNTRSKRIFINGSEFNAQFYTKDPCGLCEIHKGGYDNLLTLPVTDIPIVPEGSNLPPTSFFYSSSCCVDCTLRGSNIQPWFWQ